MPQARSCVSSVSTAGSRGRMLRAIAVSIGLLKRPSIHVSGMSARMTFRSGFSSSMALAKSSNVPKVALALGNPAAIVRRTFSTSCTVGGPWLSPSMIMAR